MTNSNMFIKKALFVKSSPSEKECPKDNLPEFAFIGRSNVGKSSLINFLSDRKNLAKTSVYPGKTRLINHFIINDEWYLVDLPGYGYAKVSKKERDKFNRIIYDYIRMRLQMVCLFVLIDSRHEPMQSDIDFVNWLGANNIPFALVFTKTDKLAIRDANSNIKSFFEIMLNTWEEMPKHFLTSVKRKKGKEELLDYIAVMVSDLKKNKL